MKLPNGKNAVVDIEKLIDYCLNPEHPRGKHKARVFLSSCGLNVDGAERLRQELMTAAVCEAMPMPAIGYGQRYVVECSVTGPTGTALVRSAWIVRTDEDFPRFVSAFVL
jgi:hypothetical protein